MGTRGFHGLVVLPAPYIQRALARNEENHGIILKIVIKISTYWHLYLSTLRMVLRLLRLRLIFSTVFRAWTSDVFFQQY